MSGSGGHRDLRNHFLLAVCAEVLFTSYIPSARVQPGLINLKSADPIQDPGSALCGGHVMLCLR